MEIQSSKVYDVLTNKSVNKLYHANTVATACHFLRSGSILSRGTVERKGLFQTPQSSDTTDKFWAIWFDVFVDSVDVHHRIRDANVYGPVLLVFDASIIKHADNRRTWVTKLNPTKWGGKKHKQRWFMSDTDLEDNFVVGDFDQMIVFRHCGGELSIHDYLKEIILDDPQKHTLGKMDFYSIAYGALRSAMSDGGIDAKISRRKCRTGCKCIDTYKALGDTTRQRFFPHDIG
jgi:hypothetical protein